MSVNQEEPVEKPAVAQWKKWLVGVVCLAAVAASVLSIVSQIPHRSSARIGVVMRGGSAPAGGGAPGGPRMPGTGGRITTVGADAITLQGRDGVAKTFALTAATKITVDQKPVAAAELKAGQRARVVSTDGKSAAEVHVRTRPPSGGGYPGGGAPVAAGTPS